MNPQLYQEYEQNRVIQTPAGPVACHYEGWLERIIIKNRNDRQSNGWISIKDVPPPIDVDILCYSAIPTEGKPGICFIARAWKSTTEEIALDVDGTSLTSYYDKDYDSFIDSEVYKKVTHWQPIPAEPPSTPGM